MADENDIEELIGRMTAAQRQGFHVTPAAIRIIVIALRFYLATKTWLAKPHADPHDDAPRKKPEKFTGPPATIANLRQNGIVACTITCDGPDCWNAKRVTFDDLGLPDETAFPDILRWRGFRCQKCGCRRVRVSPDWTNHRAQGNGRKVH